MKEIFFFFTKNFFFSSRKTFFLISRNLTALAFLLPRRISNAEGNQILEIGNA